MMHHAQDQYQFCSSANRERLKHPWEDTANAKAIRFVICPGKACSSSERRQEDVDARCGCSCAHNDQNESTCFCVVNDAELYISSSVCRRATPTTEPWWLVQTRLVRDRRARNPGSAGCRARQQHDARTRLDINLRRCRLLRPSQRSLPDAANSKSLFLVSCSYPSCLRPPAASPQFAIPQRTFDVRTASSAYSPRAGDSRVRGVFLKQPRVV
jgi:hypothetical protein